MPLDKEGLKRIGLKVMKCASVAKILRDLIEIKGLFAVSTIIIAQKISGYVYYVVLWAAVDIREGILPIISKIKSIDSL